MRLVERLDDTVLDRQLVQVQSTYYVVLHGTIQHNTYHAGQIVVLKNQLGFRKSRMTIDQGAG